MTKASSTIVSAHALLALIAQCAKKTRKPQPRPMPYVRHPEPIEQPPRTLREGLFHEAS